MIKKVILSAAILLSILTVNAQAFTAGSKGFNLGAGFDLFAASDPAIHFSGEIGVIPISTVGTISFGANTDIIFVDFDDVRTHLAFRAAFHLGFLNTNKFDVYAGIGSGVRLYDSRNNSPVYFDEFIGARMMLRENFGLFLETGYGATSIKAGVAWIL